MADIVTVQELRDASLDVQTLETFVNGSETQVNTPRLLPNVDIGSIAELRKKVKDKVDLQIATLPMGHKGYATLALAQAAQASLPANTLVEVTNDTTTANNGVYVWNGTTLTKSNNDVLGQAKTYVDTKVIQDGGNSTEIFRIVDASGKAAIILKTDGKLFIVGLDTDLASKFKAIDVTNLISQATSSSIFEIKDANGSTTIKQLTNGDLLLPSIGNLTTYLNSVQASIKTNTGINLDAAHLAGKYADYTLAENLPIFETTDYLLKASNVNAMAIVSHPVNMLRIPAITRIAQNKYLLFFEVRESQDDFGKNSQCVATITIDNTTKIATTSDVKVLHEAFTDSDGKLRTFMNACAVKLESGRIICLYVKRYSTTEHQLYMRTSDDDGVTWSDYTDISAVKNTANINLLCPCSQGLIKRFGKHKGRIIFPVWSSGTAYSSSAFRSGYIYSDDNGVTWNLGEFVSYATSNEVQIAEDLNGDMLFSVRLDSRSPPKVLVRLRDYDKVFEEITTNITLTNEAIMSGLVQGDNTYDFSASKFILTACRTRDRKELLVHTSYDNGQTWRSYLHPKTIGQAVAYSCAENLTASHKFLLWECDNTTNLKYSVVSLTNLIKG